MNVLYLQSSLSETNRRALDGVRRFAAKAGWNLTALHYGTAAKAGDRAGSFNTPRVLGDVLVGRNPDGCIVEDSVVWKRMAPVMERSRVPCVVYDVQFPASLSGSFTHVVCDNAAVVDAVAKELFAFGFNDYAFVPHHEPMMAWSKAREEAFRKAVSGHFARFHVYHNTERNVNVVSAGLVDWLRRIPRPCGLFAVNDQTGVRVLEAAATAGIVVPTEIVVVGVDDDLSKCETTVPTLTSVRIDVEGGGYAAAEALDECIRLGRKRVADRLFGVAHLVRRASSRQLRIPDSRVLSALEFIRRSVQNGIGISVEDVAKEVQMPLRTLHRRFLKAVGHTLGHEIREMRFEQAKHQLAVPGSSVDSVASFCGYDSASTLRKLFARRLGKPPSLWKKSMRH